MKKWIWISLIWLLATSFSFLKPQVLETSNFKMDYPENWKVTNDDGIFNVFPDNEIGAITISGYENLNLPDADVKKFILELNSANQPETAVKSKKVGGATEYYYDFEDQQSKITVMTKLIKKNNLVYIITLNCKTKYWNGQYRSQFLETYNSFKLKK